MAIFKLGAFATAIVGSIGGTNFKRGKNNAIITNKSFGGSTNKLKLNAQLGPLAVIFKKYSTLAPGLQQLWTEAALLFTFPDKFGVYRNLTGRQLFTKLNIQLLPAGYGIEDPTGIHNNLEAFTLDSAFVSESGEYAIINKSGSNLAQNFYIQADVSLQNIYGPNFSKKLTFYNGVSGVAASVDIWADFIQAFPYFNSNYKVAFYVCIINEWGFKTVTQFVKATVTA
jgi:hypothetical protein